MPVESKWLRPDMAQYVDVDFPEAAVV